MDSYPTNVGFSSTKACAGCSLRANCTNNKGGRMIERSEHAEVIQQNRIRVEQNKDLYRRRQAIVEHPYGTLKRQWGFNYILTKKYIKRASADVGLMLTAYNLRRIINLIGIEMLKKHLSALFFIFGSIWTHFKPISRTQYLWMKKYVYKINMPISNYFANFISGLSLKTGFDLGF